MDTEADGIYGLEIGGCRIVNGYVAPIARLGTLRMLSLNGCGVGSVDLWSLQALQDLEELDVGLNKLDAGEIGTILTLMRLKKLNTRTCEMVDIASIPLTQK